MLVSRSNPGLSTFLIRLKSVNRAQCWKAAKYQKVSVNASSHSALFTFGFYKILPDLNSHFDIFFKLPNFCKVLTWLLVFTHLTCRKTCLYIMLHLVSVLKLRYVISSIISSSYYEEKLLLCLQLSSVLIQQIIVWIDCLFYTMSSQFLKAWVYIFKLPVLSD